MIWKNLVNLIRTFLKIHYIIKKSWYKIYIRENAKYHIIECICLRHLIHEFFLLTKSLFTMLEEIKYQIMDRNVEIMTLTNGWILDISPMAILVLEENKELV